MKTMKKILALVLAMAMVLAMSVTAFAAGSATITVYNLEAGTQLGQVQVIEPNQEKPTGWSFTTGMYALYAPVFNNAPEQDIIWALIQYANPNDSTLEIPAGVHDIGMATTEQVSAALEKITVYDYTTGVDNAAGTITVSDAGMYAIDAKAADNSSTIYEDMAAYVSFTYNDDGVQTELNDTQVYAKKSDIPVGKDGTESSGTDVNDATEIGKIVDYEITTAFPNLKTWTLTDTLTGGTYVRETEGPNEGKVAVAVKINNKVAGTLYAEVNPGAGTESIKLNLDSFLNVPANIGAEVTLTYSAKVTATTISNEITDGKHNASESLFTGKITLTKYASDDNNDDDDINKPLEDAVFIVYKKLSDNSVEYAKVDEKGVFVEWTTEKEAATELISDENGQVFVDGLDLGTYYFEEVRAPKGYSVNENDVSAEIKLANNITEATEEAHIEDGTCKMYDSKLSSLPSTGGIGTTIFTIGGCVIMIVAAGMYFASRRKEEN